MRQKIELNAAGKAMLAKTFKVSVQNVSQALLFRKIREAALINGGSLVQIIDVTDELKRTVKVLDSHGNVTGVVTNK